MRWHRGPDPPVVRVRSRPNQEAPGPGPLDGAHGPRVIAAMEPGSPLPRSEAYTLAALVLGAVGLVVVPVLPRNVLLQAPVLVAADVVLGLGLYGLLRAFLREASAADADRAVPALAPALVTPTVVRVLAGPGGVLLTAPLATTLWFEATVIGTAAAALWVLPSRAPARRSTGASRPGLVVGLAGLATPAVLVAVHLGAQDPRPENLVVVAGVVGLAGLVGLLQRRFAGGLPGGLAKLGRWAPATLAGAQLLDGLVTSFAIENPLGLILPRFGEANPVSDALLEAIGPGFALLKYGVGLATGLALEVSLADDDAEIPRPALRVAAYLLVLRFSLGPGVFSALQLLM